jgi:hypothetical protein
MKIGGGIPKVRARDELFHFKTALECWVGAKSFSKTSTYLATFWIKTCKLQQVLKFFLKTNLGIRR